MLIRGLRGHVRILNTSLSQSVVSVGEARIRYNLSQYALESLLICLFFLPLVVVGSTIFVVLTASFLSSTTSLLVLLLRVSWCLFFSFGGRSGWLNELFDLFTVRVDRIKRQVGCMRERVLLFDGNPRVFLELMRAKQAQNRVRVIGEDDVSRRVQFDKNMVSCFASSKGDINDTIDAKLCYVLNFLSSQMFS